MSLCTYMLTRKCLLCFVGFIICLVLLWLAYLNNESLYRTLSWTSLNDLHAHFSTASADCTEGAWQEMKGSSLSTHLEEPCDLCQTFRGRLNVTGCTYRHPNLVHYVKLTDLEHPNYTNALTFHEYVSIVSVHKFYSPDKIVIHCNDINISGSYWERLARDVTTPIEVRHVDRVQSIGHLKRKPGFISHEADYIKLSTILREGGIFMDFDVVILNGTKLRLMQERSECVIGRDNPRCTQVCAGFYSCVPNSIFIRKWLDSYENDYKPKIWVYNAGEIPSHLLCDCPSCYDVFVDSHMSNWKDGRASRWLKPGEVDWRSKAVSHYMNRGFMKPIKPPEELLRMNTPFSDMFKHVLGDTVNDFLVIK